MAESGGDPAAAAAAAAAAPRSPATSSQGHEAPDANTLRILVATDNHLGFAERDPIRCEDSFNTFEEIMVRLARVM